ncbi:hypothetical protein ANTQUA_LOCUS5183 [Anthophora quadrimaculata]
MKARTILLLSAAFFCVFHYARAIPWSEERFDLDSQLSETAAATSVHRYTRDLASSLISTVENIISGTIQIPEDIVQNIVRFIRGVINTVEALIGSGVRSLQSVVDSLSSGLGETADFFLERKRRAVLDIMEMVPDVMLHPVNFLERSVDTARNYANGQMGLMTEQAMNILWNYVLKVLLPWIHSASEQLEKSNDLPSTLRNVLHEFDSTYSLLQTLGYVESKSGR